MNQKVIDATIAYILDAFPEEEGKAKLKKHLRPPFSFEFRNLITDILRNRMMAVDIRTGKPQSVNYLESVSKVIEGLAERLGVELSKTESS